jgi:pimeloyl-ACP methyl ester carboxylesterase
MSKTQASTGVSGNGLPYNRLGHGPPTLVVFQGLQFDNKPPTGLSARLMLSMYSFLQQAHTTYVVNRRPGLPEGYTMQDMADDYAIMIRDELAPPVDVMGTSTGGSIALHFAADHADLVRRLVIHSSAHTLGDAAKEMQLRLGHLAGQGKWREASALLLSFVTPPTRFGRITAAIGGLLMAAMAPKDPSDLMVTVEAEDKHNFKDRLGEIKAPTLVIAGDQDRFYSEALFRETADGIPNARLILYKGMGHPASGKDFGRDVLAFLKEGRASA